MATRRVLRITTVVRPHNMPPASASASPSHCKGGASPAPCAKPLPCMATSTPAKANTRPAHCQRNKRSDLTKIGNKTATQNGAVYRNSVMREAVVYFKPT